MIAYAADNWAISRKLAGKLIERAYARLSADMDRDRPVWKAEHIARLKEELRELHTGERVQVGFEGEGKERRAVYRVRKNWNAILRLENLLAEITGTKEPFKIDVGGAEREAVARIVAEMPPAAFETVVQHYLETVRLAGRAREILRLPDGSSVEQLPGGAPAAINSG
jgi:hypothetical protein